LEDRSATGRCPSRRQPHARFARRRLRRRLGVRAGLVTRCDRKIRTWSKRVRRSLAVARSVLRRPYRRLQRRRRPPGPSRQTDFGAVSSALARDRPVPPRRDRGGNTTRSPWRAPLCKLARVGDANRGAESETGKTSRDSRRDQGTGAARASAISTDSLGMHSHCQHGGRRRRSSDRGVGDVQVVRTIGNSKPGIAAGETRIG